MNKLVEKFCNFSLARGFCENMRNFISYIISKYGVNTTIAVSFVILGCLPHFIHVLKNKRPKPNLVRTRSKIIKEVHSGYPALLTLLEDDYKHARLNRSVLNNVDTLLKEHLRQEFPNLMHIQQIAAKLEMSAREDDGEIILEDALKNANSNNKPQEAYEIEMLLVEMLIYKGGNSDLEKALKCKCLNEPLKDARRPLYKAIIYTMQGKQQEAKKWWDEFTVLRDPSDFPRSSHDDIHFEEFEHRVVQLQQSIQDVAAGKK